MPLTVRTLRHEIAAILLLGLMVGCAPTAAPAPTVAPTAPAAAAKPQQTVPIRVAFTPGHSTLPVKAAMTNGYYAAMGWTSRSLAVPVAKDRGRPELGQVGDGALRGAADRKSVV